MPPVPEKNKARLEALRLIGAAGLGIIILCAIAALLLAAVYWPISMSKFSGLESHANAIEKCTDRTPVCLPSDFCDDGNSCTIDKLCGECNTLSSLDTQHCTNYPKVNNASCNDSCVVPSTGVCKSGKCEGACPGYCVENECDSHLLTLNPSVATYFSGSLPEGHSNPLLEDAGCLCINNVAVYYISNIELLGFDRMLHDNIVYRASDEYLKKICYDLLDPESTNLGCLDITVSKYSPYSGYTSYSISDTCPGSGNCSSSEGYVADDVLTSHFCVYRYKCANSQFLPLEPIPTTQAPTSESKRDEPKMEKRQFATTYRTPSSGGFGGSLTTAPPPTFPHP